MQTYSLFFHDMGRATLIFESSKLWTSVDDGFLDNGAAHNACNPSDYFCNSSATSYWAPTNQKVKSTLMERVLNLQNMRMVSSKNGSINKMTR